MDPPVLDSATAIRTHLDEALTPAERAESAVRFVLCDGGNRVRVHCPVDGLDPAADPEVCQQAATVFATALAGGESRGGMLVVLTRPGSAAVTAADRVWFHATRQACAEHGIRMLGVHVLTPATIREIVLDDAL
jgi:hypothetical protein